MNPFAALISVILGFYTSIVLLRFFLQYFRADYYNPISQLVIKATNPFIKPLRKFIPGFGGLDVASLVLAWLVILTKELLIALLSGRFGELLPFTIFIETIFGVLLSAIELFIFMIIVRAILSWFPQQNTYNPVIGVFTQLTEPLLRKFRRILPPLDGFDLSPMVALLALFFIYNSITYYLMPLVSRLLA